MPFRHDIKPGRVARIHTAVPCAAVAVLLLGASGSSQEPAVTSPATSSSQQAPHAESSSSKSAAHRHTPFDDFLIRGTVFNDKALAFPGVDIRIRRAGEKKFHWQDVTNSRGDFAIRVPHNATYEIVTHAKGFLDQTKTIDAKPGSTEQNLSFQMESARGKK
jgi:hypothetical protein